MTDTLEAIRRHRIVIIYRGEAPEDCVTIARSLYDAGIRLFEVTLNSDRPLEGIALLRKEFGDDVEIGAGTVLEPEEVDRAAEAGAGFIISPDLDESVIARTKQAGLVSIPGALTPTEIRRAVRAGADLVKVFPIRPVGGADYIRQLRGPLPDVPMMATGGVDAALARECFAAGCDGIGVGVHLLATHGKRPEDLAEQATALVEAAGRA